MRYGRQKKNRNVEEEDRKITAYHESGHAVVAALGQRFESNPTDARIAKSTKLLLGQAILAEGGQLDDPVAFAELVNELMAETL